MTRNKNIAHDCNGEIIMADDYVSYIYVSNRLLKDLPLEDQEAINAQKGKSFKVISIDKNGYVEIEFEYGQIDLEVTFHTVWVDPCCLKRIPENEFNGHDT